MTTKRLAAGFCLAVLAGSAFAQERTMGLLYCDSAAFAGYTLFAPLQHTATWLIDNQGRVIDRWQSGYRPGNSAYLLENGDLLRAACINNPLFTVGGTGGRVERFDWDGNLVWAYEYSSDRYCQHHDIRLLPNGNILMIAWERKTLAEALAAGRNPELLLTNELWPDHVVEVNPGTDSIVWEWHVWDHLIQSFDSTRQNYGVVRDHPELIDVNYVTYDNQRADWNHSNSVTHNPELDQVMISSRYFSEVWVIDHGTTTEEAAGHSGGRYGRGGDLLYRWGNPAAYGRGNAATRRLYYQHDANWLGDSQPGTGHIACFNNGMIAGHAWSEATEFAPPTDSLGFYALRPDSTFGPDSACWTFGGPGEFFSSAVSGVQRLPNGNTLICDGQAGELFEVTPARETAWRYINPVSDTGPMFQYESIPPNCNAVFKALRYAPTYPAFNGRSLVPGDPVERYPPGIRGSVELRAPDSEPVAPGPTLGGSLVLRVRLGEPALVELDVYDALGQAVARRAVGLVGAGERELAVPTAGLGAGAFFCRVRAGARLSSVRFVVVR
jgi:hypothetical protein